MVGLETEVTVTVVRQTTLVGVPVIEKLLLALLEFEVELKKAPIAVNDLSNKLNIKTAEANTVVDFLMDAGKITRNAKNELMWK